MLILILLQGLLYFFVFVIVSTFIFSHVLCSTLWQHHTSNFSLLLMILHHLLGQLEQYFWFQLDSLVFIFNGYYGSLEAFNIFVSFICVAIWFFWLSKICSLRFLILYVPRILQGFSSVWSSFTAYHEA